MSSTGDFFSDLQQQQLDAMRQFQDAIGETMKFWQDAMSSAPGMPVAEGAAPQMQTMKDLAEGYFKFAGEMLNRQHEFALRLIDALTPRSGS